MSIVKIESKAVAEIKNALTIIQGNADLGINENRTIQKQVTRIDRLLPKITFEEK